MGASPGFTHADCILLTSCAVTSMASRVMPLWFTVALDLCPHCLHDHSGSCLSGSQLPLTSALIVYMITQMLSQVFCPLCRLLLQHLHSFLGSAVLVPPSVYLSCSRQLSLSSLLLLQCAPVFLSDHLPLVHHSFPDHLCTNFLFLRMAIFVIPSAELHNHRLWLSISALAYMVSASDIIWHPSS